MSIARTTCRPPCEVKRRRARLMLRWEIMWEAPVITLFIIVWYQILFLFHRACPSRFLDNSQVPDLSSRLRWAI